MSRSRSVLAAAVSLAVISAPLAAGSAAFASVPHSVPRSVPHSATASVVAADDAPATTWSVEPATAKGSDGREAFAYSIKPGVQITDWIAVTNSGTTKTTYTIYATDATNEFSTGAFSLLPADIAPKDVGSWITMGEKKITLQPRSQARIPFTILVPSDATPGDHTAGIVASVFKKSTDAQGKAVTLEQRVGARVYMTVAGKARVKLETTGLVSSFAPPLNPFSGGDATVDYSVTNAGNYRVDVAQKLVVTGPFGLPLFEMTGEPIVNVLPGQAVHETLSRSGVPPVILMFAQVTLTPGTPTDTVANSKQRSQTGKPVAERPQPKYEAVSATTTAAAIPWTLLGLVVLLVGGVWLLLRYLSHSRQQVYDAIDAAAAARDGAATTGTRA